MIPPALRLAMGLALIAFAPAESAEADEVLDWNATALDAIRADRTAPPIAARNLAMAHAAIYDAVNAIATTHEPYLSRPQAPPDASQPAAAASAAHRVLSTVFPQQRPSFDARFQASLAAVPEGPQKSEGIRVGQEAADAILQSRQGDLEVGSAGTLPPQGVGVWGPVAPGQSALLPGWGRIRPFCMRSGDQFRQKGPPKPQTGAYANAFERVKALGAKNSAVRTPEQTQIALFWADGPGTATPPGHWNVIAQDVSRRQGLSPADNARAFALLNLALADAAIAAWDMKYTYHEWRPISGIRLADQDGNNRTEPDPNWEPLVPTPPFPDYVSGHSTFSTAGAEMLSLVFGNDRISFTTTSDDLPGVQRSFTSFSAAAEEAGESRIFGGIHWAHADKDGAKAGRQLARHVSNHHLKKLTGNAAADQQGQDRGQGQGRGRGNPG